MNFYRKILIVSLLAIICGFFPNVFFAANQSSQLVTNNLTPKIIEVPQGKIEYYRFGHGTPLILIAGYFANVKSWNIPFLKALAAEHDVIIFDNRNVGGSVSSSKSYTAFDLARDVKNLLKTLHISHANILGISMGGMIAQQFAISYPEMVDHLILVNTFIAGIPPVMPSEQVQADLYSVPKGKLKQYSMALRILFPPEDRRKMFFAFAFDRFNPHFKEAPLSQSVVIQQQNLVHAWIKDTKALKKIQRLKMPVLILSGGSDYVIPFSNADVLKKEIPKAKLVRWEDGGHAMTFQHPESIASSINQWLSNTKNK
jgi:pimeloyl-ACP methyl ester carboxylesterase